ncbi:hypothetical protein BO86DRAFT_399736 [Aspergillus japonicus CBS 114.51]|uniref:Uncharacterized protein n=1 Tax=Aspergillus japonicus CBS 114.51 TaxID=1448312 RepID=A0A8T8X1U2_ASPJA|nr:hypothetical protein BO86DRAFT_399736 [Aspergillus japonicus CBS 114.51]RAH81602.1 hypothetical protein BO86DRAFT_399736 [Aspergillus japonicus CBS 114.51]
MEKQPLDNTVPCSLPGSERSLEQQMELSPLELSFSRQLEVHLTVALPIKLTPEECLAATRQLITEYPILGTRLNLKAGFRSHTNDRSRFVKGKHTPSKLGTIFRARTVNLHLEEFVPSNTAELCPIKAEPEPVFYDPKVLENLVQFKGGRHDGRQALSIRTVHLRDACVIQFIVQHALSDAGGIHWIARTYCALLSGTHSRDTAIRPEFQLKPDMIEAGRSVAADDDTPDHPIAVRYSQGFQVSWARFLVAYLRQRFWAICPTSARRVRRMLFVPQSWIDGWMAQARSRGVQVTEHDLLMAFVYQSAFTPAAKAKGAHTGLIFTLNIQPHLASVPGALTNPWINVPVSPIAPGTSSASDDLIDTAHHIRQTIQDARNPVCVAQIIDQHLPVRDTPAVPRGYGSRTPRVALTSWCHLPWYGLDVKGTTPLFVLGNTRLSRPLTKMGVRMDDGLTTCKARASARTGNADGVGDEGRQAGYWLQGRVNEGIWTRMMEKLNRSGGSEDVVTLDESAMDKRWVVGDHK